MKKTIERYVLQNFSKYGEATPNSVLGKVLGEKPELKKKVKEVLVTIEKTIKEIKKWNKDKQEKKFKEYAKTIKTKEKETVGIREFRELPELKNVGKKPIFRIEIGPSGMLHIGHIITILLNSEYAKKYKGKFILRISDTNPDNIEPTAYKAVVEDTKWITEDKVDEIIIQSDNMDLYYLHAKTLIDMNKAYICTCATEFFREKTTKKEACPCREQTKEENLEKWNKMFTEYQQGEAVLRIKTDIRHKNPAIRDWPAFRINDNEHPKTKKKYRVWPLMNFSVAVDDHEEGMTHVIHGKDHTVNDERKTYLYKHFGWKTPEYISIGRINFTDMKIKTSLTKEEIQKGNYEGWEDARLPFVGAFRRRGILPAAFTKYIHELGPSKVDKTVNYAIFMQAIYSYNKEFVDHSSKRYFFVEKPTKVTIKDAPTQKVTVPLHPDEPTKGQRTFVTEQDYYINDKLEKNKMYRFMHLFNFKNKIYQSDEYDQQLHAKLIHWLPVTEELVRVWVHMPDGTTKKGLGEKTLKKAEKHDIVQLERVGFCKIEKKEKDKIELCYGHR
tara:strand:+ start:9310 stop:10977 length:1668 start_codon:yes stop_codon:yes gene_type:complete